MNALAPARRAVPGVPCDAVHIALEPLVEQYGLIVVFLGSLAEGETAAIVGGLLAHQKVFLLWQTVAAAFAGAAIGDGLMFLLGRRCASHPRVEALRARPGFDRAYRLLQAHPDAFVLANRFVYGMRLVGGLAAGLAGVSTARFVVLNGIASMVWALVFTAFGYGFGVGIERLLGQELLRERHLLVALGLALMLLAAGVVVARRMRARSRTLAGAG